MLHRHSLDLFFLQPHGVNLTWADGWKMTELIACLQDMELEPQRRDSTLETLLKQWGEARLHRACDPSFTTRWRHHHALTSHRRGGNA